VISQLKLRAGNVRLYDLAIDETDGGIEEGNDPKRAGPSSAELYSYPRENWQFASLVQFHVLSEASRRLRFEAQNLEGIHRCCCLSATSTHAGVPSLLLADDSRHAQDLPSESFCSLRIRNMEVIDQIYI
jgi:hypothetical protein